MNYNHIFHQVVIYPQPYPLAHRLRRLWKPGSVFTAIGVTLTLDVKYHLVIYWLRGHAVSAPFVSEYLVDLNPTNIGSEVTTIDHHFQKLNMRPPRKRRARNDQVTATEGDSAVIKDKDDLSTGVLPDDNNQPIKKPSSTKKKPNNQVTGGDGEPEVIKDKDDSLSTAVLAVDNNPQIKQPTITEQNGNSRWRRESCFETRFFH